MKNPSQSPPLSPLQSKKGEDSESEDITRVKKEKKIPLKAPITLHLEVSPTVKGLSQSLRMLRVVRRRIQVIVCQWKFLLRHMFSLHCILSLPWCPLSTSRGSFKNGIVLLFPYTRKLKRWFYLEPKLRTIGIFGMLESEARFQKYHFEWIKKDLGRYNPT